MNKRATSLLCLTAIVLFGLSVSIAAQQPSTAFTYQGQLSNNGVPANGSFDLQFKLFDIAQSGSQQGATVTLTNVSVANGIFTVQLDFGEIVFVGNSAQFLEIGVRPGGSASTVLFTVLAPRVPITPTPYSVRAASAASADSAVTATQLGGVAANQYVQTNDSRLSDARDPISGSLFYIQNGTPQQQGNFNITGNGIVGGFISASTVIANQYDINGFPVLRSTPDALGIGGVSGIGGSNSTFVGNNAGRLHTGINATFVGHQTGSFNTTGNDNSFFGARTGVANSTGSNNSFFGSNAGTSSTGDANSFFGAFSGASNKTGTNNSFFGSNAGFGNSTGAGNSFFGFSAGFNNNGTANSFFGAGSGQNSSTGINNSFFGQASGFKTTTGQDNTYIGNGAGLNNLVANDNTIVGSLAGASAAMGDNNSIFGFQAGFANTQAGNSFFGSLAGTANTTGFGNAFFGFRAGSNNVKGISDSFFGANAGLNNTGDNNTFVGDQAGMFNVAGSGNTFIGSFSGNPQNIDVTHSTAIGSNATVNTNNTIVLGTNLETTSIPGNLSVSGTSAFIGLGSAGSTTLCRNNSNQLATCSSSLRYKTDIAQYNRGLDIIDHLRPISFTWKDGGMRDLGFGAEDVAKIEPLLVTYNKQGQVEGLKYDRITVALVNAMKEQQTQISGQQKQIELQQQQIESLKQLLCADHPEAAICK